MTDETRIIELEQELIELRRAAVSVVLRLVPLRTDTTRSDLATELDRLARTAAPVEARLLRLVAEALRRE
ncbi:hypothetical protein [Falsirhodobacter halotolerans]|uniref:hypothetical protein n=1 Tax=Falsirhodobacter halotolerans TaxID=1146892 RepID=UPI001FCF9A22|nr:hypothetical protein [Falsirhodobacter halotolerans]MCJ8140281.1 hypothetical protein [Falsirhodobacter halotolerans]